MTPSKPIIPSAESPKQTGKKQRKGRKGVATHIGIEGVTGIGRLRGLAGVLEEEEPIEIVLLQIHGWQTTERSKGGRERSPEPPPSRERSSCQEGIRVYRKSGERSEV